MHRIKTKRSKMVKCPVCGKYFMQTRTTSTFCSVDCRIESTRISIECQCDNCGKIFKRKRSEYINNKKHYCSESCKRSAMWWSNEDDNVLREYYGVIPTRDIIPMLSTDRDVYSIRRRAQHIDLSSSRKWTNEEVDVLVHNYDKIPMGELQLLLPNRSRFSIIGQARCQGLFSYFYYNHNYSDDENEYLRLNYIIEDNETLAEKLGRSKSGIAQHLRCLGLFRPTEISGYKTLSNYIRSRLTPWRDQYRKSNNYTCAITGERSNVVVHHIRGFNLLLAEAIENAGVELHDDISEYSQTELDNIFAEYMFLQDSYGQVICIAEHLHKEFHSIYGYGGNTESQWVDFIKNRA